MSGHEMLPLLVHDELFKNASGLSDNTKKILTTFLTVEEVSSTGFSLGEYTLLSEEESKDFASLLEQVILPELAKDFDTHRLRIAWFLSFCDSRNLDVETREKIGLSNPPDYLDVQMGTENNPPRLNNLTKYKWNPQCLSALMYLEYAFLGVEGITDERSLLHKYTQSGDFLGCMVGKMKDIISGLCYKTAEFSNGVVFIEGVFYRLNGPYDLVEKLKNVSVIRDHNAWVRTNSTRVNLKEMQYPFQDTDAITVDDQMVVMVSGGDWQPTHSLFTESKGPRGNRFHVVHT